MKKPVCLCCFRDGPEHDGHQLFQPGVQHPCAWVHWACLFEYLTHHLRRQGATLTPDTVCVICEVIVPGEDLWALRFNPSNPRSALWLHPECVAETNYYRE